jgi:hypothetical protein
MMNKIMFIIIGNINIIGIKIFKKWNMIMKSANNCKKIVIIYSLIKIENKILLIHKNKNNF